MASIRGPRSALTDFIEENKIKINRETNIDCKQEPKNQPEPQKIKLVNKKTKRVRKHMPVELINLETIEESDKDKVIQNIITNLDSVIKLSNEQLFDLSSYISRKRIHNTDLIQYILRNSIETLVIHDCSHIKDSEYVICPNLISLELYQCGQLTSATLNNILKLQPRLKSLKLTGGYLLTKLDLPSTLQILDFTHCSRLNDTIISEINSKFTNLEELRLSFCYKITGVVKLAVPVKRLFLCETNVNEDFVMSMPKIEEVAQLSLKMCRNINNLNVKFINLEHINIEGLTELKDLWLPKTITFLNCKQCFGLNRQLQKYFKKLINLTDLNISYLSFKPSHLYVLKNLKTLDISWCPEVTDSFIVQITENINLHKLSVFGCFGLTPSISATSWKDNSSVKVFGNPAETKYLILND